ncbi:MAG: GTP-binding protein [Bacteroidales bacterium]|nr:GTP-binding protein [Bacteroidales bacterium]
MRNNNIPVLLLTGYLGSGKTTLLNNILTNQKGIKFAVIVNDIGEVNIDADLIEQGGVVGKKDDSLVALQNGCICCTLKMDLVEQLDEIAQQQKFDYIVIEASGICEPEPIAQTICSIPSLGEKYVQHGLPYLDCIVTVVDALRMKDEFGCGESLTKKYIAEDDLENLVIQQIEFCNIILLNKSSEVTESDRNRLKEIIRALQPKAKIIECDYGKIDLDEILETGLFDFDKTITSATWVREVEDIHDDEDDDDDDHDHEEEHEHHHHDEHDHDHHHHHNHEHHHEGGETEEYGISTFVYNSRRPFNLGRFDEFVARKMPSNVIRCKGICYFKNEDENCYVFDQAGKQVTLRNAGQWYATMPEDELEDFILRNPSILRNWDDTYGDRMQKLVFIGQHMDKEKICSDLNQCLTE